MFDDVDQYLRGYRSSGESNYTGRNRHEGIRPLCILSLGTVCAHNHPISLSLLDQAKVLDIQLQGEATPTGLRRISGTGSGALAWERRLRERVEVVSAPAFGAVLQPSVHVFVVAAQDEAFVARHLIEASVMLAFNEEEVSGRETYLVRTENSV